VADTLDQVFVHTVEDLIDFTLTKIEHPLNLIPKTTPSNFSKLDDFQSNEEGFNLECSTSELDDMEDNNGDNEERGNPPHNNQPWLARDALEIPG
jgi:hypothetical protein